MSIPLFALALGAAGFALPASAQHAESSAHLAPPSVGSPANAGAVESRLSTLPVLTGTFGGAGELDSVAVIAQQVDDAAKIGDTLAEYEVPAELSVTGDDYAVGVRPDDVPRSAFDANGVVDLEVQLSSRRDMWVTYLSVRLVRDASTGTLTWIDPIESLPSNAAKVSARVANGRQVGIKSVPTRIAKERARVKARDLVRMPARYRETYRTTAPGSSRAAAAGICENKYLGDRNVSTTIATSYPVGATKSWLEVRSSEGGKHGIGLSTGKGASFTASGTRFVEGAWSFSWTKQSVARSYRIQGQLPQVREGRALLGTAASVDPAHRDRWCHREHRWRQPAELENLLRQRHQGHVGS
ncbi:hypothetical protein ABFU82_11030 [Nocardioides sp. WV_118_6]